MHPFASLMLAGGIEQETLDLVARMTGAPTQARINLIDATIKALKNSGVWAKLDALWIAAAHDSQARTLNWKGTSFTLPTVGTTFTADRGFTGETATTYTVAAGVAGGRGYLGFWSQTAPTSLPPGTDAMAGSYNAGPNAELGYSSTSDRFSAGMKVAGTSPIFTGVTGNGAAGYYAVNRSGDAALEGYIGTVQVTSTPAVGGGAAFLHLNGLAGFGGGAQRCAAAAVGAQSLSQAEHNALYAALAAYMTAVGA